MTGPVTASSGLSVHAALFLSAMLLASPWAAGSPLSDIETCDQIAADQERLKCFDREVAKARALEADAPAVPAQPQATELTPQQKMGLTPGKIVKLESPPEAELKELSAKIQAAATSASGRGVFTLDNGQVWRQVEADPHFSVRPGDSVRITRGALGSYFMSVSAHMSTRVSRTH